MRFKLRVTVRIRTIGSGQDKPFGASLVCLAGFCVNRKEVFILYSDTWAGLKLV